MSRAPATTFWSDTAVPAALYPRLENEISCDVAVVGAGFTGLSAAHHLTEAGVDCVVLEAEDVGFGASGRSAGFMVLRYKRGFAALAKNYGAESARLLHEVVVEGADTLAGLIDRYGMHDVAQQTGHITAAHGLKALEALQADARWLEREAADRTPRLLGRAELAELLGADIYVGGCLDPRGGAIHPLSYVRRLAAGLAQRGVRIFVKSAARAWRGVQGGVVLEAERGVVRAKQLIIATNAYSDMEPGLSDLHRRIVPVNSSLLVTEPISANLAAAIIPSRAAVTDTKRILSAFRMLPGDRLLVAGRGDLTGRDETVASYEPLQRALERTFPAVADVKIARRWSGRVAVPLDDVPHIGRLADQVVFALGYAGRGVALAAMFGKLAARMALGATIDAGPASRNVFPLVPFHGLRVPVMRLLALYYGLRDRLDRQ